MIQRIFFLILVVLFGSMNIKGEQTVKDSLDTCEAIKLNGQYLKRYWTDTRDVVKAPLNWNKKQWMTAGAVVGTTGLLFLLDEDIQSLNSDIHSNGLDRISEHVLEPWGSETPWKNYSFYAMGAMGAYGLIANDHRSWNTALLAFEAYALSYVYVRGIKWIAGRERPEGNDSWNWNGPGGGKSFPSNHTASVFAMAAVVAEQYKDVKWVPWASYSFATLVGASRIYDNEHWASDVFMGACIGTAVGQLIARSHQSESLSFIPVITPKYSGLSFRYSLK